MPTQLKKILDRRHQVHRGTYGYHTDTVHHTRTQSETHSPVPEDTTRIHNPPPLPLSDRGRGGGGREEGRPELVGQGSLPRRQSLCPFTRSFAGDTTRDETEGVAFNKVLPPSFPHNSILIPSSPNQEPRGKVSYFDLFNYPSSPVGPWTYDGDFSDLRPFTRSFSPRGTDRRREKLLQSHNPAPTGDSQGEDRDDSTCVRPLVSWTQNRLSPHRTTPPSPVC